MTTEATHEDISIDPNWADDTDSALGDDASSRHSLSDSVREYRRLHGRTFQNFNLNSQYWGPNDQVQNEGLDLSHQMILLAMDEKLHKADIGINPQRIIDVGTGTGVWAIDMADEYPSAEVVGTDLSPIQPDWVPTNCRFELSDAQSEWPYPDDYFDFVHIRCLMGSIRDWPALYRQVYRCLKPGGWIEHFDYSIDVQSDDNSIAPGSPFDGWGKLFGDAGEKMGQTFKVIEDGRNVRWQRDAGFHNINQWYFKLPFGDWPADPKWKKIGLYNSVITDESMEGYVLYSLSVVHGWDYDDIQDLVLRARQQLRDKSCHAYFPAGVVWSQKPLEP